MLTLVSGQINLNLANVTIGILVVVIALLLAAIAIYWSEKKG